MIGLILGGVGVVVLLVAVAFVVTTVFSKSSTFAIGSCVKQDGTKAQEVSCDSAGAFKVVAKEDTQANCPDPTQPFVVLKHGGKTEVLCLSPADKK